MYSLYVIDADTVSSSHATIAVHVYRQDFYAKDVPRFCAFDIEWTSSWIVSVHINIVKIKPIICNLFAVTILALEGDSVPISRESAWICQRVESKMYMAFVNSSHTKLLAKTIALPESFFQ
jgi:hypothetical protein